MGSSKSTKILKSLVGRGKKKDKNDGMKSDSSESAIEEELHQEEEQVAPAKKGRGSRKSKGGKRKKRTAASLQSATFTNKTISNLSRALGTNDWIKLAYALGFLPQGIAHFVGRASSSQNSYSQCTMMLKTWRAKTPVEEILPRLCDALQRIRRHDLAVKVGLELSFKDTPRGSPQKKKTPPVLPPELLKLISERPDALPPSYESNKMVLSDDKISFLSRQILAKEEWKRLAYALGFLPDDASQIIASASSSQNLYAQAHLMLEKWRSKTPAYELASKLRKAFIRIRRHDLVFLLDLGAIVAPPEEDDLTIEEKIKKLQGELRASNGSLGNDLISKFPQLQVV